MIEDFMFDDMMSAAEQDWEARLKAVQVEGYCALCAAPFITVAAARTACRPDNRLICGECWPTESLRLRRAKKVSKRAVKIVAAGVRRNRTRLNVKRKKLLRMLATRIFKIQVAATKKINDDARAVKAAGVLLRRNQRAEWYNSNPPRVCKVCGVEKRLFDFKKKKSGKYGGYTCRVCSNRCKNIKQQQRNAAYRLLHPLPPRTKQSAEEIRTKAATYRRQNREAKKAYKKEARKDPMHRVNRNFSEVVRKHFRALKESKPLGGWKQLVGYTLVELKEHLEKQFTEGMTWSNYGDWHIDHIRPIASFTFTSAGDKQFLECWALNNLQPLWAAENESKGATYDPD